MGFFSLTMCNLQTVEIMLLRNSLRYIWDALIRHTTQHEILYSKYTREIHTKSTLSNSMSSYGRGAASTGPGDDEM